MTKKDIKALTEILSKIQRGNDWIMGDDVAIMKKHTLSSCDFFYSDYYKGEKFGKVTKDIGNLFCLSLSGQSELRKFIESKMKAA